MAHSWNAPLRPGPRSPVPSPLRCASGTRRRIGALTDGFWSGGIRRSWSRRTELVLADEQAAEVDPLVGVHDELRLARLARQKQQGKSV